MEINKTTVDAELDAWAAQLRIQALPYPPQTAGPPPASQKPEKQPAR